MLTNFVKSRVKLLLIAFAFTTIYSSQLQVVAQDPAESNGHYMGREIATTMHYTGAPWLVRESRQREEDCRQLLKALDVKPGQVVCDMGCGNGFYTLKLANLCGKEGKVYAVDIQQGMLDRLRQNMAERKLANYEAVLGAADDPRLPAGRIDLALLVDVYHEFSQPQKMLRKIRASLAPDGRMVLLEYRKEDPQVPILPAHKMSVAEVKAEIEPEGFRLEKTLENLPRQHILIFRKNTM